MIPPRIEREVLIDAPIEVVWNVVTEPDQMKQWFADEVELEPRVGGRGRLAFTRDRYELQVEAMEPPRRFAFRWVDPERLLTREVNSMLVEFTLDDEAGRTRLRVVESGFDMVDWSDEKKATYAEDHSHGWEYFLGRLRDFAVQTHSKTAE